MAARFFDWLSLRPSPVFGRFRELVRQHSVAHAFARGALIAVRGLLVAFSKPLSFIWPPFGSKLRAIMAARQLGGGIGTSDLARLWDFGRWRGRALCLGGAAELRQIQCVLRARGTLRVVQCAKPEEARRLSGRLERFSRIIIAADPVLADVAAEWQREVQDESKLLVLTDVAQQPDRHMRRVGAGPHGSTRQSGDRPHTIAQKLSDGDPLTIVLINDVGFQFGAGIAMRRQATSFLLNGWNVAAVAWSPGTAPQPPSARGFDAQENWLGFRGLLGMDPRRGLSEYQIISGIASSVSSFSPDVIIIENIHGAGWPPALAPALGKIAPTAVYMHDCYWVTGRCAHAGPCELYKTGCDARCPTAQMYPPLAPEKIAPAWMLRGDIFGGPGGIPLIANSSWTRDFVRKRFGDRARTEVVHLGLDHQLFAPIPKGLARELLRVPQDKTVVLLGSVDMRDRYKGGPLLEELHQALIARKDVAVILFGQASDRMTATKAFGLVRDERLMPFIYSAADIFVSASTAESFGQTLLEASACGVPVVAFDVGGVRDVIVNGETGILVDQRGHEKLLTAVDRLIGDSATCERFGRAGRARVEQHFTLERQADAWIDCLKRLW
jgi:glycosyltransferase involved in cell wall biosynthesis